MLIQIIKFFVLMLMGKTYVDRIDPNPFVYALIYSIFDGVMNVLFVGSTTPDIRAQVKAIMISFLLTVVFGWLFFYLLRLMRGNLGIAWLFMLVGAIFIAMFL